MKGAANRRCKPMTLVALTVLRRTQITCKNALVPAALTYNYSTMHGMSHNSPHYYQLQNQISHSLATVYIIY